MEKLKEARSKARLISFSKRDPDNKYAAEQFKIAVNKVNVLQSLFKIVKRLLVI